MKNNFAKWLLYAAIWIGAILIICTVLSSCKKTEYKTKNTYVLEVSGSSESMNVTWSDASGVDHFQSSVVNSFVKVIETENETLKIHFSCFSMWPDDHIFGRIYKNGNLVWSVDRAGGWSNFEVTNTY
jgi:hypothetical protein